MNHQNQLQAKSILMQWVNICLSRFFYYKSIHNCFDILAVEKEYDGPHLEADGRVTKEFMLTLLPYFENQKKLHKRYAYQVKK